MIRSLVDMRAIGPELATLLVREDTKCRIKYQLVHVRRSATSSMNHLAH